VSAAEVSVGGEVIGRTLPGPGLMVLLGAGQGDEEADAELLADKICGLRIFEDEAGRMNRSVVDVGGSLLIISQFTLYGDCRKGRRPSFAHALEPERAERLVAHTLARARTHVPHVATGRFGAHMAVTLTNDGPVTLLLDSRRGF
jgi:D-tyrosyl-tRNA(Tyr) deacylase